MTVAEIIAKIKDAGIVGAGGAGFPTYVKIDAKVNTVIANGAECEPLLKIDQQLSAIRTKELVEGMRIIMRATNAEKGIFAFKSKYHEAISAVAKEIAGDTRLSIGELENFYPAGDEQILIYELTGKLVPEGGIPLNVGIVVNNVGTMMNVYRAINENKPVVERGLSVVGAVKTPVSLEVPIGTYIKDVIEFAGGPAVRDFAVINGGPMMGKEVDYNDAVVTKTTSGIIVLPTTHYLIRRIRADVGAMIIQSKAACCQCTECTVLCSRFLLGHRIEPHKVMRTLLAGMAVKSQYVTMAYLCSECNICALYACPMHLSPMLINRQYKSSLSKSGIKNPLHRADLSVHPARDGRKVPTDRLISHLNLKKYNVPAPFSEKTWEVNAVKIPLKQHIGASSIAIVRKGAEVKEGQLIARIPAGKMGANLHSGITGIVEKVDNDFVYINARKRKN